MIATLVSAWTAARKRLRAAGVDSPAIDARLLLEAAASVSRSDILADPHRALPALAESRLSALVKRRLRREPVSQILGRKDFWTIRLRVTGAVLTPRPETETLVEAALTALPALTDGRVLDLGVGSGAILLAVLSERAHASGVGIDVSAAALDVARTNTDRLDLSGRAGFVQADWAAPIANRCFDVVVVNPPYIPSADIQALEPEVRDFEPRLALDGGADGLEPYRRLAPEILRVLRPGGAFFAEVGRDQAQAVRVLFERAGAGNLQISNDLSGIARLVRGRSQRNCG